MGVQPCVRERGNTMVAAVVRATPDVMEPVIAMVVVMKADATTVICKSRRTKEDSA